MVDTTEFGEAYGEEDEFLYGSTSPKSLPEMTWKEVEEALEKTDIALVTTGSIENHGPHLPLGADALKGPIYAKAIARKLKEEEDIDIVVGPTIPFGRAPWHMGFPGTINLRSETHINVMVDVMDSLVQHGFEQIVLLNCHGGNAYTAPEAARIVLNRYPESNIVFLNSPIQPELEEFRGDGLSKSDMEHEFHGGETETARMMYAYPKLVNMDEAKRGPPADGGEYYGEEVGEYGREYGSIPPERFKEIWPHGTGGDPFCADAETGERLISITVDKVSEYIATYMADN